MKRKNLFVLGYLLQISITINSQYISGAMNFSSPVAAKDSNNISLAYSNLFYFRDYEFFNPIQTGYTLFGAWHHPRIAIQPRKWLRLEAGALLQKEFGDKQLDRAWPVFSLQMQQKNFRFIFGALEGNQAHQLIEPLMSYDKIIERPVEEGFQLKLNTKKIYADFWLDWEIRQKENSDYSEELTGGLALNLSLSNPENPLQLKIPAAFIFPHKGGQLDTNGSVVTTAFNYSAGLSAEWKNPDKNSWLNQFKTDAHYTHYKLFQNQAVYPFIKGDGLLFNFLLQSKWNVSFLSTFWKGNKFIAPKGNKLMQSISSISGISYTEPERQLLFFNLIYEKELFPGFFVDGRYTSNIDLRNHKPEHSFLILLSYRNIFRLGTLKQ